MSERSGEVSMRHFGFSFLAVLIFSLPAAAQTGKPSKNVEQFVRVDAAKVVLAHVRVIDGTGTAAVEDRNVVIEDGKISAIENGTDVTASKGATILRSEERRVGKECRDRGSRGHEKKKRSRRGYES